MTVRPHPARLLKKAGQPFDYPTVLVGKTPDGMMSVYYDPALGKNGAISDAGLLGLAQKMISDCVGWFGIAMQPVNLILADLGSGGTGDAGAYHYGCDFATGGDLYIDADLQNGGITMDEGLTIAELTECFMGAQGKGWNCGGSGGEALSRMLAELDSRGPNGALAAFASAPRWDQAGRPDWISTDQGSDQDYPSIGCGMVYLSWMMAQGFSAAQIAQAGEPNGTLQSNYEALTGSRNSAYRSMTDALKASKIQITSDDPFGGISANPQPAPSPAPPPPSPPPAPPNPPPPPAPTGTTKADVIAAFTALVNASTLP